MHAADAVWNRALDWPEPPGEREGDAALRTLLSFHGAAMNGGPLHAWEVVGPEGTAAAVAGYRYFSLADAASAVEWLRAAVVAADLDDIDAAEAVELQADDRYYSAVPDDEVLVRAFEAVYDRNPAAFAPID